MSSENLDESISVKTAGRKGGLTTLNRHGRKHFIQAGKKGQKIIKSKYTQYDRRRWGALGGRPQRKHVNLGEETKN